MTGWREGGRERERKKEKEGRQQGELWIEMEDDNRTQRRRRVRTLEVNNGC